ncbi:MAG: cupin domain-containing protein, partial [Nanoarchaeota archaeon]
MATKISMRNKIKALDSRAWHPIEVAQINDQALRLALFKGEYHWHSHNNEDELMFVYKGRIVVQFKDRPNVELAAGELIAIPKG